MGPKALLVVVLVCMGILFAEGLQCYYGPRPERVPKTCDANATVCIYFTDEKGVYTSGDCSGRENIGCKTSSLDGRPPVTTCYCARNLCNKGKDPVNDDKNGNNGAAAFKNSIPVLFLVAIFTVVAAILS